MKKTLLLSVVASTMIMAGGDIAPVEPVVASPAAASAWEFSGHAVGYYQSLGGGDIDVFDQEGAAADAGIQLRATNNDVIGGIGAGFAVNGLSTLNLENGVVSEGMQGTGNAGDIDDLTDGGWISEAYLTYGFGNTSIKAGRQTLPKSLSPFAFSENWNVFENTFDSVLVVNTDITDTALVYAWVYGGNVNSFGAITNANNMTDFNSLNNNDGVHMLTVQNKSIANLTLTGTWYYATDFADGMNDLNILWGDAAYDAGSFNVAVQGGQVTHDAFDTLGNGDHTSFGAKIAGAVGPVNAEVAYSTVNDGGLLGVATGGVNLGGSTSALYTTTLADELLGAQFTNYDADKWVVRANMDALGGNISAAYAMTSNDTLVGDVNEFDLGYSANITDNLGVSAVYANIDPDLATDSVDVVRVIANYKF